MTQEFALDKTRYRFVLAAALLYSLYIPVVSAIWLWSGMYDHVLHVGGVGMAATWVVAVSVLILTLRRGYDVRLAAAMVIAAHVFPSLMLFVLDPGIEASTIFIVLAVPTLVAGFAVRPWAALLSAAASVVVIAIVSFRWLSTSEIPTEYLQMAAARSSMVIAAAGLLSWYYTRRLEQSVLALTDAVSSERHSASELTAALETSAVLEKQLRQKLRMESLGRLAGGVAHDFNNLLTVIISNAALISENEDVQEEAQDIQEAGKQAARMTHQLLAFARRQVLKPELINLNELISNTEPLLRRLIRADVELVVETRADLPAVELDAGQMEQVLINLVTNAHDAIAGSGEIRAVLDIEDDWVTVDVHDDGAGIAAEDLDHVFEPFFTTRTESGTGLGMATVHGIVTQSEGMIAIDSTEGVGTRVSIRFPARGEAPRAPKTTPTLERPNRDIVLLVDDAKGIRTVGQRILENAGFRVKTASNGAQALTTLEESSSEISLVISDIVMPEMGGIELAEQVRERWPDMPLILMSGYSDEIAHIHPDTPFLNKPFTPEDFYTAIGKTNKD